jgi:protein-disulfide isomerase-like protein with CxxC motif
MTFDTHTAFQRIIAAKNEAERADAVLAAIKDATTASGQGVATRLDVSELETKLTEKIGNAQIATLAAFHSELRTQSRWLGGLFLTALGVATGVILHFMH